MVNFPVTVRINRPAAWPRNVDSFQVPPRHLRCVASEQRETSFGATHLKIYLRSFGYRRYAATPLVGSIKSCDVAQIFAEM